MLAEDLDVFKETLNLASRLVKCYELMPRIHRYQIGATMCVTAINLLKLITAANAEKEHREKYLLLFLREFSGIKACVVICDENKLLPTKQIAILTRIITSISKQITAWKNTARM